MDAIVEAVTAALLEQVVGLLKEKVGFILNAKENLKELRGMLQRLQKALEDTEGPSFLSDERDGDEEEKLKDVLYEVEDIIEEYRTQVDLQQREKGSSLMNKVRKPWTSLCSCYNVHVRLPYQLGNNIKDVNQKLIIEAKLDDQIGRLLQKSSKNGDESRVTETYEPHNPRETTHHLGIAELPIDRQKCNDEVKKLMLDGSSSVVQKRGISIVSIVGKGGIGKTTIAQTVFKDVEKEFGKCRWWVCVGENANPRVVLRKILKEVCKQEKDIASLNLSDLCARLQQELPKNKFLLVLDDVWEYDWWNQYVEGTLMVGARGSKILITSRRVDVSKVMGAQVFSLPEMTLKDSWTLFLNAASMEENDLVSHNLKDIGEKIVFKCGGLPLVIRAVGFLMRIKSMTRVEWNAVARSEIWDWKISASSSSSQYGSILPGLILSYDQLPNFYLKSCFVYCCIFPKDHEITREELIMHWVAHGLVEKKKDRDVEVTANQYVDDLINRCLIEETEDKTLKLHDILHDLASYIGGKEYSHAMTTAEHTRHLSLLDVDQPPEAMHSGFGVENKLRTLLVLSDEYWINTTNLTNLKWLRVLSLSGLYEIDELLDPILQNLVLLKYLDLSSSGVTRLPSSIGRVRNLQTLNLSNSDVEELPKEIGDLFNLRYLGLLGTTFLSFVPEGLGRLSNLRTLTKFLVCDDKENKKGCNVRVLRRLNKLKGELLIEGLGEAEKAIHEEKMQLLTEKHDLYSLVLNFEGRGVSKVTSSHEQISVLEVLEPPRELESLKICHYKGQVPSWHSKGNNAMLQTLVLERCPMWVEVVPINSLTKLVVDHCPVLHELASMPLLKSLEIKNCDGFNTIGRMPALEELTMWHCDSIQQIPEDMPALKLLDLSTLDTLKQLPAYLPSLEVLRIWNMLNLETIVSFMPCLREMALWYSPKLGAGGLFYALSKRGHNGLTQLQWLDAVDCPSARLEWKLLKQLPNLIHLRLDGKGLESTLSSLLPSEVPTFLPNLEYLHLTERDDNFKWGTVPEWVWGLSNLKMLVLEGFSEEISLGGHWHCFPKLAILEFRHFPNLKSLVDINDRTAATITTMMTTTVYTMDAEEQIERLSKLENLKIHNCPALHLPQELMNHLGERLCIEILDEEEEESVLLEE